MKENLRVIATHLLIITLGCIFFGLVISSHKRCKEMKEMRSRVDTVVRVDTLRIVQPIVRDSVVVRYVRVPVVREKLRVDTLHDTDTAYVELPIMQKHYSDSTYAAWVSGYQPKLDSIFVYPQIHTIIHKTTAVKPKRWQFGLQGGVGMTPKGIQPYVGVGVGYRIF